MTKNAGARALVIAVAVVAWQRGQDRDADLEGAAGDGALGASLLDLIDDVLEHVAEVHRDDRRRGFVGAETMIVARARDARTEEALPLVDF